MARAGSIFIIALLLGACASMSKDECLTADWRLIGFEDGSVGHSRNQIGERRRACADHGVVPDKAAYDLGYDEGILTFCSYARGRSSGQYGQPLLDVCPAHSEYQAGYVEGLWSYCTYERGREEGLAGNPYHRVCSRETETDFLAGYDQGYHVYDLKTRHAELLDQLEKATTEQQEKVKLIEQTISRIALDTDLTAKERADLLIEVEELRKQNKALAEESGELAREIERLERQLAELGYQ